MIDAMPTNPGTKGRGTIVIDLDGTLCWSEPGMDYESAEPRHDVIARLREYRAAGFEIAIHTARNMRSLGKDVGRITAVTVPVILAWLEDHDVPFDELHVGKPWPGREGFYVDDRSIRPSEFVALAPDEVARLLSEELA